MEKRYLTTSIAYANSKPHIGFALEVLQGDAIARWHRINGFDTWYLTGTDEHGTKIAKTAEEAGVKTFELANQNSKEFQNLTELLNLTNDDFIRTSDQERHWPGAQKIWNQLVDAGDIYKDTYQGLYCVGCEAYVTEKELEDGKCPYHNAAPEKIEEENYFFRLSKYGDQIAEKIKSKELEIIPEGRAKEILNVIGAGLEDISFSRPKSKLPWGVPVPGDDSQTMYVWCDALSNYLSAIGFGRNEDYTKWWPADLHIIGKDILRFHAAIWPGMLLSVGIELPKKILVHGFISSEDKKMSKSIGNVVSPREVVGKYSADVLRYYLLREIPTMNDGDFSWSRIEDLYNNELADNLGNLLSRVVQMVNKYAPDGISTNEKSEIANVSDIISKYKKHFEDLDLQKAVISANKLVQNLNGYVDEQKPWELAKDEGKKDELQSVLYALCEGLRLVAALYSPFIPGISQEILKTLNLNSEEELKIDRLTWGLFPEGHKIADQSPILFPKDK
ncbi:MAG: methionine--tRNA ligase [Patescibacteria group bacterium]|nr:methionine--tRNA ligase [Patescibacteria group bacterium]